MSTYTSSLGLEQITPGDQAGLWGNTTNNNLALIDQAVTGVTPISFAALSGTTYTLTDFDGAVDEARSAVLNITGIASGANTVIVPNKQKTYLVRNATGQDVTFRTATPSQTYAVGAGNSILIFCDGNNNVFTGIASPSLGTLGVAAGGTGQTSFAGGGFVKSSGGTNALTASATVDLASEVSGVLPVSRGGSGAGTFTTGSLLVGNGTGNFGTLVGGGAGQVATWNGSTWTAATPASAGVSSFNSRTGAVTLTSGDVTGALGYTPYNSSNPAGYITSSALSAYAPIASPTFTGNAVIPGATFGSGGNQVTIGTAVPGGVGGILSGAYNIATYTSMYGSSSSMAFSVSSSSPNNILVLGTSEVITGSNYVLRPASDGASNLGLPGNRWATVYAAVGSINTSDRNEKTEIEELSDAERRVAQRIKKLIKKFKFKDAVAAKGSNARIHVGVIAQEVEEAFKAEGLDANKYGLFCYDQWGDKEAVVDKSGVVQIEAQKAGSRYGVRYEELLAFVIAAL